VGDDAGGRRHAESRGFVVELAEQGTGLHECARHLGLDAHATHRLQVDHEPAFAGRLARDAVPSGADGGEQLVLAREVDGLPDVRGPGAAGDECGLPVEQSVPDAAPGIIGRITLQKQLAPQPGGEILHGLSGQVQVRAVERPCSDVADALRHRAPAAQRSTGRERSACGQKSTSFHGSSPVTETIRTLYSEPRGRAPRP
jgi:hypothetical protein